jgi:curved DNA-binding protein CbpA
MPAPHRDSKGYYRVLQIACDATDDEIQLAYEWLEELPPPQRKATWSQITRAYSVLKNHDARRAYDRLETQPMRLRRRSSLPSLNDARLLVACIVLFVGIVGFVWVPLYGSRFRSFSPGDALVTTQGAPFGKIVKTEDQHIFPTGTSAPAYLVALHGSDELRWYPMADIKSSCRKSE